MDNQLVGIQIAILALLPFIGYGVWLLVDIRDSLAALEGHFTNDSLQDDGATTEGT